MAQETGHHVLDNLSEYLDGEAAAEWRAEIERHLASCVDCRVMVDTLRKTVAIYRELPQPELPAEARLRLYASLDLTEFLTPKWPDREQQDNHRLIGNGR
jgi:anti-sigma factor RsiW